MRCWNTDLSPTSRVFESKKAVSAWYNEIDPYAAQWLRSLISAGHIAPGDVDERSIVDVRADDLAKYTQCHFFAGIGIWSAALRQAGWDDARPVWTGSCPCQPLSAAGKGLGTRDERHLWPNWFELIRDRRPLVILGEQVASPDGLAWLDIVCTDLENEGYPVWPIDLCAAGFGAPNIRQRLWFMADPNGRDASAEGLQRSGEHGQRTQDGRALRLADAGHGDWAAWPAWCEHQSEPSIGERPGSDIAHGLGPADRGMGNASGAGLSQRERNGRVQRETMGPQSGQAAKCRSNISFWSDADWIECADGKARPVEPGTFPLAHGYPQRMGRLRAYGNALNQEAAAEFIAACREISA